MNEKKFIKEIYAFTATIIVIVIMIFYMMNDGIYVIRKAASSNLELINSVSYIKFPEDSVITDLTIEHDTDSEFYSHNEMLNAAVQISNKKVDELFPQNIRFPYGYVVNLSDNEINGEVDFCVWTAETVTKWFSKTQRNIYFTVMKAQGEYTTVYLYIDKLGWNRL